MTDEKKFKLKKKEADLLKGPSRLEENMNLEGKAEIRISEEHKVFAQYISEYVDASANVYQRFFLFF